MRPILIAVKVQSPTAVDEHGLGRRRPARLAARRGEDTRGSPSRSAAPRARAIRPSWTSVGRPMAGKSHARAHSSLSEQGGISRSSVMTPGAVVGTTGCLSWGGGARSTSRGTWCFEPRLVRRPRHSGATDRAERDGPPPWGVRTEDHLTGLRFSRWRTLVPRVERSSAPQVRECAPRHYGSTPIEAPIRRLELSTSLSLR